VRPWCLAALLLLGACNSDGVTLNALERESDLHVGPVCNAPEPVGTCMVETCCREGQCFYLTDDHQRFDCDGEECHDAAYEVVAYCE